LRIAELLSTLNIRAANIYINTYPPPRIANPVTSTTSAAPQRQARIHPIATNQSSHIATKSANTMGVQDANDIFVASTALIDLIHRGM
jgi:hypothetical protein